MKNHSVNEINSEEQLCILPISSGDHTQSALSLIMSRNDLSHLFIHADQKTTSTATTTAKNLNTI